MKFRKKPVIVEAEQFFPNKSLPFNKRGPVVCFDDGKWYVETAHGQKAFLAPGDWVILEQTKCQRCDGDGKAHGSDRPFEWSGPGSYPGPCPVCRGSGAITNGTRAYPCKPDIFDATYEKFTEWE